MGLGLDFEFRDGTPGGPKVIVIALDDLVGEKVTLHSLKAVSLNGQQGVAIGVVVEEQRLIVKLRNGRTVKVRGQNISSAKLDAFLKGNQPAVTTASVVHACNAGCGVVAKKGTLKQCSRCRRAVYASSQPLSPLHSCHHRTY